MLFETLESEQWVLKLIERHGKIDEIVKFIVRFLLGFFAI